MGSGEIWGRIGEKLNESRKKGGHSHVSCALGIEWACCVCIFMLSVDELGMNVSKQNRVSGCDRYSQKSLHLLHKRKEKVERVSISETSAIVRVSNLKFLLKLKKL